MKDFKIIELDMEQVSEIEDRLEAYDNQHITYRLDGRISLGIQENGELVAGVDACMSAYHILYVVTLFVDEKYRGNGLGRLLMSNLEEQAKKLGANMIRVDTFDFQGKDFYEKIGYNRVGEYENKEDGFAEYFYVKYLTS